MSNNNNNVLLCVITLLSHVHRLPTYITKISSNIHLSSPCLTSCTVIQPRLHMYALQSRLPPQEPSEEDLQDTDRHIESLWRVVNHTDRGGAPVYIIPLVLCHDSFSQTVENLFALSFLVRDGRVRFTKTPAGLRVVPITRQQRGEVTAHLERRQAIMTVSMSDWARMKRAVPRSACLVPARSAAVVRSGGQVAAQEAKAAAGVAKSAGGTPAAGDPPSKGKRRRTVLGSAENVITQVCVVVLCAVFRGYEQARFCKPVHRGQPLGDELVFDRNHRDRRRCSRGCCHGCAVCILRTRAR